MIWTDNSVKIRFYRWKMQRHNPRRYSNYMMIGKANDPKVCAFEALKAYTTTHQSDYLRIKAKSIWLHNNGSIEVKPLDCWADNMLATALAAEHGDLRCPVNLFELDGKQQHAPQRRQLAVDTADREGSAAARLGGAAVLLKRFDKLLVHAVQPCGRQRPELQHVA